MFVKRIAIIFIVISILILTTVLFAFSENVLLDLSSLSINVKNKEYTGKKFLSEGGMLYTNLAEIVDLFKLDYEFIQSDEEKLFIIQGDEKIEYLYDFISKKDEIFVPLTTFSQSVGYKIMYDEQENILDIFQEAIPVQSFEEGEPDFEYSTLIVKAGDRKYDGVKVIVRSLDERYLNVFSTVRLFQPLELYLSPGKYKIIVKDLETNAILDEKKVETLKDLITSVELKQ